MERLTIKALSGLIHLKDNTEATVNTAIKKLSDYEDLEEQNRLLKLPCAVGDTVYTLNSLPRGKTVIGETTADAFMCALGMLEGRFGETIFLTQKEAENKLAEMEVEKDVEK